MPLVTRVAEVYRSHLARFFIFRFLKALALSAYRAAYRLRSRINHRTESGFYQWLAIVDLGDKPERKICVVRPPEVVEIPAPKFSGHGAAVAAERTPPRRINVPALEILGFSHAMAVGGIDFVFVGRKAIHHELFVPAQHQCPAENIGVVTMHRSRNGMSLNLTQEAGEINAAATLIGQCSANYAHWLTETLPKLPILDAAKVFSDFPLLVDDGLHPNIYESIDLINKNRRKVIRVSRWQPIHVERLVALSATGYERYVPQGVQSSEPPAYVNVFSRTALRMLREAVITALGDYPRIGNRHFYLARSTNSGNLRQVENAKELEAMVRSCGVQPILPESMSFMQQVAACVEAELIVAPVGAALANMIFAPPGCRIVALAPYYADASYFYFTNLAGVLGHKLHFVLGSQVDKKRHPMHQDYRIEAGDLLAALQ